MKKYNNILALSTAVFMAGTMQGFSAAFTFLGGGSINNASFWENDADNTTGTLPGSGDTAAIAVNGTYTPAVFNNAASFTQTAGDIVGAGNANFNFITGTYTMTGGSFSARGLLANNSTINLLGGTFTVGNGSSSSGFGVGNGGDLNIGGSAVIQNSRATAHNFSSASGTIDIAADWTGSWENDTIDLAAWKTELTTGNYELAGVSIDGTLFDNNFQVTGNTLSLIPEPSSAMLLGLASLVLIRRRR